MSRCLCAATLVLLTTGCTAYVSSPFAARSLGRGTRVRSFAVVTVDSTDVQTSSRRVGDGAVGETSGEDSLQACDVIFGAIDINGDGSISSDELRHHLLKCGYTESAMSMIFNVLDADGNGDVSREEFQRACAQRRDAGLPPFRFFISRPEDLTGTRPPPIAPANEAEIFSAIDVNGDGSISSDELRQHLLACGYMEEAVAPIFGVFDVDASGDISRAEFERACALREGAGLPPFRFCVSRPEDLPAPRLPSAPR